MTFDKKLTIAVLLGVLPLMAATIYSAVAIAGARRDGAGIDAFTMTAICMIAYGLSCLVLVPAIGVVADRSYRRKLALERRARTMTWLAASTLLLPPLVVNGLYYLLLKNSLM